MLPATQPARRRTDRRRGPRRPGHPVGELPRRYSFDHDPHVSVRALSELAGRPVAFEVDEFDPGTKTGWSVLLKGSVRAVEAAEMFELRMMGAPQPWAGGVRNLYLRLSPHHVTGRELR